MIQVFQLTGAQLSIQESWGFWNFFFFLFTIEFFDVGQLVDASCWGWNYLVVFGTKWLDHKRICTSVFRKRLLKVREDFFLLFTKMKNNTSIFVQSDMIHNSKLNSLLNLVLTAINNIEIRKKQFVSIDWIFVSFCI